MILVEKLTNIIDFLVNKTIIGILSFKKVINNAIIIYSALLQSIFTHNSWFFIFKFLLRLYYFFYIKQKLFIILNFKTNIFL